MKVLFIYPNAQGYSRIPLGLCIVMTMLEENGHELDLFDTTFLMHDENTDSAEREAAGLVISTNTINHFKKHSLDEIDDLLRQRINDFSPDMVAFSILEDNYKYSDRLFKVIKHVNEDIPILVGGTTPTVAPKILIENPNIDWLMRGECEHTLTEFCNLYEKGESVKAVAGVVYKESDGNIVMNPVPSFADLNELPFPNYDHWADSHLIKPYDGKLYRSGFIEMSRGCMFICSYCVNVTYQAIMKDSGKFFRGKTVDRMIEEAKYLTDKFDLEMFFFCDDNFLSITKSKLEEFAEKWTSEIGLPFWINTTVESLKGEEKIIVLKNSGCAGIGLGIETGSESLRRDILHKFMSNEKIKTIVDLLNKYDYRTTANIMIGFPGENVKDVNETVQFIRSLQLQSYNMSFVSPYYATPVYEIAKSKGYIDIWEDKPGFNGFAKKIGMREGLTIGPPIDIPTMSKETMMDFYFHFTDYIEGNRRLPGTTIVSDEQEQQERIDILRVYHKKGLLPLKLRRDYSDVI
jgi:anaerobic magnesium-protoporphyrin IX monomethyl ester cyclase